MSECEETHEEQEGAPSPRSLISSPHSPTDACHAGETKKLAPVRVSYRDVFLMPCRVYMQEDRDVKILN